MIRTLYVPVCRAASFAHDSRQCRHAVTNSASTRGSLWYTELTFNTASGTHRTANHGNDSPGTGKKNMVKLADGSRIIADVIVGADGVHSVALAAVDKVAAPEPAEQTMYRFLIPTAKARKDPRGQRALDRWSYVNRLVAHAHFETSRQLVIYACRNNDLLNAATLLPIAFDPRPDELEDA